MRLVVAGAALLIAAAPAHCKTRDIETSWGKPGVSFAEYHQDASLCAAGAVSMDVSGTAPAQRLVKASQRLDTIYETASMYNPGAAGLFFGNPYHEVPSVLKAYQVEQSMRQIHAWQVAVLEGCLRGLGYRKFALTPSQRSMLKRLPLRSEKRRAFLHGLASNPAVLASQAI